MSDIGGYANLDWVDSLDYVGLINSATGISSGLSNNIKLYSLGFINSVKSNNHIYSDTGTGIMAYNGRIVRDTDNNEDYILTVEYIRETDFYTKGNSANRYFTLGASGNNPNKIFIENTYNDTINLTSALTKMANMGDSHWQPNSGVDVIATIIPTSQYRIKLVKKANYKIYCGVRDAGTRQFTNDAPFDMFCLPYTDGYKMKINGTTFENNGGMALAMA